MALVDAQLFPPIYWRREIQYDEAPNVDSIHYNELSPPLSDVSYDAARVFYGIFADNLPIVVQPRSDVSGSRQDSFLDDYYYRVHIDPNPINLGNLVSTQNRVVYVWSAYFETNLLSSIVATNDDGLYLAVSETPPTYFGSLESRSYSLSVSISGSPTIDAQFQFTFEDEQPTLLVTGRRVIVWPFRPNYELTETLSWSTDILRSYNKEQRISVRPIPRQKLPFKSILDSRQFAIAKILSKEWIFRVFATPLWYEATKIPTVASGTTQINLDTSSMEYTPGGFIFIYESSDNCEIFEIDTVNPASIIIKLQTSVVFKTPFVMPAKTSRCLSGIKFGLAQSGLIDTNIEFTIFNDSLIAAAATTQFLSYPVILNKQLTQESVANTIIRSVDIFDSGSSIVEVDTKTNLAESTFEMSMMTFNKLELWQLRQLLYALKGQQKAFWLPTWNQDLEIVEDFSDTASSIVVKFVGYSQFFNPTGLLIKLKNGSIFFNRVTSASLNAFGFDQLNLQFPVGITATVDDVDVCCFMNMCRLASDDVKIQHFAGYSKLKAIATEVPYVVSAV